METVFITGGAGYVGSNLVPRLLDRYNVIVYDLFLYKRKFKPHPNLIQIKGDIRDRTTLLTVSTSADYVIHLASISNDPSFDLNPKLSKSINFEAIHNITDMCSAHQVKRLIVASSTSQYGIKPLDLDVTEDTPAEPITDYAKYKLLSENVIRNINPDFEYVFVRPSTLCGYAPRLRLDLVVNIMTINALVNNIIKVFGGDQMRPTLNINDMSRFYELLLKAPSDSINKEAFNLVYKNMTVREIAELVRDTLDSNIKLRTVKTDDNRSYHVNGDKAKNTLGFKYKHTIEEGILSIQDAFNKGLIDDGLNNPLYHNVKMMKETNLV